MNPEEFVKAAKLSGYASEKAARSYIKQKNKETYTEQDFIELYHGDMKWTGCGNASNYKMRSVPGMNGKTTAFGNGIRGNSGAGQDWN